MSNIIEFPKTASKKVKVNNEAAAVREHNIFTENLVEALIVNMIHNMSENGIDVDKKEFLRDTSFLIELVRSMIYRDGGVEHSLQDFTKMFIEWNDDGEKPQMEMNMDLVEEMVNDFFKEDE